MLIGGYVTLLEIQSTLSGCVVGVLFNLAVKKHRGAFERERFNQLLVSMSSPSVRLDLSENIC